MSCKTDTQSVTGKRRKPSKPRCGGLTTRNKPCRETVDWLGARCRFHQGQPDAKTQRQILKAEKRAASTRGGNTVSARRRSQPPQVQDLQALGLPRHRQPRRPDPRPRRHRDIDDLWNLRTNRRKVREAAAEVIVSVALDGWQATVADELGERLSPPLLQMTTSRWSGQHCRQVARLARLILKKKERLHDILGGWLFKIFEWLGRPRYEQVLARELGKRAPLPLVDDHATALARGLQIVGIAMCLHAERPLVQCACFKDVVLAEGKDRIKQLMQYSIENWHELNRVTA